MGSGDEHWTVIQDISRAQELTGQLQAVLLPLLPDAGGWSELARDHMREMIRCYASALDRLRAYNNDQSRSSDEKSRKKQLKLEGGYKSCPPKDTKRRKLQDDSYSIVTSVPYEDGHQWRKYGQKPIQGSKHQRSYFRCTYSKEQGCRARKTVQQEDTTNVYPPKYRVVYAMLHTCCSGRTAVIGSPFVLDSVLANNNSLPDHLLDYTSPNYINNIVQHQQHGEDHLYDVPPKSELVARGIMHPSTSELAITYDNNNSLPDHLLDYTSPNYINNIVQHQQHGEDHLYDVPPKSELVARGIMHPSTSELAITYDKTDADHADADADAMVLKLLISPELDAFYEAIMDNMHASGRRMTCMN